MCPLVVDPGSTGYSSWARSPCGLSVLTRATLWSAPLLDHGPAPIIIMGPWVVDTPLSGGLGLLLSGGLDPLQEGLAPL